MTDPDAMNLVFKSLDLSGFPFQTYIADVIRCSRRWSVHASEYLWRDFDDSDNFLDIVATDGKFILTVECKKTRQDIMTFLRPVDGTTNTGDVDDFWCLRAVDEVLPRSFNYVYEKILPKSRSCEFCVVSTSVSGKDQRLLERDASLLIRATDRFALNRGDHPKLGEEVLPLLLPLIVTNAKIYTACYEPRDISLETGEFINQAKVEKAPWVRFSKSFTVNGGYRSIFVVNATSLGDFLQRLELAPDQQQL